jgi:hypothetical protein
MKRVLIALLIIAPYWFSLAQDDCGDGLPCGKLPWDLPDLLVLPSPTPIPTVAITEVPTTGAGTPTYTPYPTATPPSGVLDTTGLDENMATLGVIMDAPAITFYDLEGTPVDNTSTFEQLGSNAGQFFGYTRSLSELNLGKLSILFNFLILTFLTVGALKTTTLLLPALAAAFSIFRKIIQLTLDFMPL